MKELECKKVWLIMSKCGQYVAKRTTKGRFLVSINNDKDKKSYLMYSSKKAAENAIKISYFSTYGIKDYPYNSEKREDYLKAVESILNLNIL